MLKAKIVRSFKIINVFDSEVEYEYKCSSYLHFLWVYYELLAFG